MPLATRRLTALCPYPHGAPERRERYRRSCSALNPFLITFGISSHFTMCPTIRFEPVEVSSFLEAKENPFNCC